MEDNRRRIYWAIALVAVFALIFAQNVRLENLRQATMFYQWMVSAATQYGLEGERVFIPEDDELAEVAKDRELFMSIAEAVAPEVDVPAEEGELEFAAFVAPVAPENEEGRMPPEARAEQNRRYARLWELASGRVLTEQRELFQEYVNEGVLTTVAKGFGVDSLYTQKGVAVSLGNMVLGFRKMAANLVWLQNDRYWHQGEIQRMEPTLRAAVALDPQFVEAYLLGAWHFAYNFNADLRETPERLKEYYPQYDRRLGPKELGYFKGIDFLKEGIRNNPRDYRSYFDLGWMIYAQKLEDYENAVQYLEAALSLRHDSWVPRTLYGCYMRNGDHEKAIAGWQDYMNRPEYRELQTATTVAPRLIKTNRAFIHQENAEESFDVAKTYLNLAEEAEGKAEAARQRGEAQAAAKFEAEARENREAYERRQAQGEQQIAQARELWQELMEEGDGKNTQAEAHLLRLQALDMLQDEPPMYYDALAVLDQARFMNDELFYPISNLMIEIKLEAGIPLNLSEIMARERQREAEEWLRKSQDPVRIAGKRFKWGGDGWYQSNFRPQEHDPIELLRNSEVAVQLRQQFDEFDEILDLETRVVFQYEGRWYDLKAPEEAQEEGTLQTARG